jgi:hypothetical protein
MRLQSTIDLFLRGEAIHREPSFWERVRRALGGTVDISTDRVRVALEATAVVDQVRRAFARLGVTDGLSLVIDDEVLFRDTEGRPDDLGDLVLALAEHASVFGQGFRSLRLAVEHREAGLHFVVEVNAVTEPKADEPAASVYVSGRIVDLEPRAGETAEAYRARVTPLVGDPALVEVSRAQFQAFVLRLTDALRTGFPEARVAERPLETTVVKPTEHAVPAEQQPTPGQRGYDPYYAYYPSPMEHVLSAMFIGMFMSSMFHPPYIMVVHPSGAPIGPADQLHGHEAELAADAPDPGIAHADDSVASEDKGDVDGDDGSDADGDVDDGDFGGGDFGDGDF